MNAFGGRMVHVLAVAGLAIASAFNCAYAQDNEGFRIGVTGGVNFNYVDASIQNFVSVPDNPGFATNDFSGSYDFLGMGGIVGKYLFNDLVGVTLRSTFDSRCVEREVNGNTFTPHLVYVTVEPGIRINLGIPDLHAMAGGMIAFNVKNNYDYIPVSGEGNTQIVDADLMHARDIVYGAWAGVGYDIKVSGMECPVDLFVTPFLEGSMLFDQKEPDVPMPDDQWWNTMTARGGVQLKVAF